MNLKEYEGLPDVLPTGKIALMFREVLDAYNQNEFEKAHFLKLLSELTDRQVMTYELLDQDFRDRIDDELCKLWNIHSYNDVDLILSIVVNLGLEKCFLKAKMSISQNKDISLSIKSEIEDAIKEVGKHISNPNHSLVHLRDHI